MASKRIELSRTFATRLRNIIAACRLPHNALAELSGLRVPHITELTQGSRQPTAADIEALAKALAITPAALCGKEHATPNTDIARHWWIGKAEKCEREAASANGMARHFALKNARAFRKQADPNAALPCEHSSHDLASLMHAAPNKLPDSVELVPSNSTYRRYSRQALRCRLCTEQFAPHFGQNLDGAPSTP